MSETKKGFRSRLDREAVQALKKRSLPRPVDALNLVTFAERSSYAWYGLLLAPRLLVLGVRPVWVAAHDHCVWGDKIADEIVIVRYPNHGILVDTVGGKYYELVNRFREKGVRWFEFSITERLLFDEDLRRKRWFLAAHFCPLAGEEERSMQSVLEIIKSDSRRPVYASREVGDLAIFKPLVPSDPNPAQFKQTAIFTLPEAGAGRNIRQDKLVGRLAEVTSKFSLHIYRRLKVLEALP